MVKGIEIDQCFANLMVYKYKIEKGLFGTQDVKVFLDSLAEARVKLNKSGRNQQDREFFEKQNIFRDLASEVFALKPIIARYFGCGEDQILLGNYDKNSKEFFTQPCPYRVVLGDVDFYRQDDDYFDEENDEDIDKPTYITKAVGELRYVLGYVNTEGSQLTSLEQLETIGGNLYVGEDLEDLGCLRFVGGDFECTERDEDLDFKYHLSKIGGDLNLFASDGVTSTGSIREVGGNVVLFDSGVTDLGCITQVGGILDIHRSKVTNLETLECAKGGILLDQSMVVKLNPEAKVGGCGICITHQGGYEHDALFGNEENIDKWVSDTALCADDDEDSQECGYVSFKGPFGKAQFIEYMASKQKALEQQSNEQTTRQEESMSK